MSLGHYLKTIFLLWGVTLLHAEVATYPYEVETGEVLYEISGGTQLTPETNLTIEGEARLRFREWGQVKLEEESGIVLTSGAIKHKQHVQRLEKQTKDSIITTDFVNEQLLERKKSSTGVNIHDKTAGLTKTGQESVAGVICDVWEGPGVKKCIYKNIVLKLESHVLDVSYLKEAIEVSFDVNISTDECEVPDFPVREFALFKDNIKTKNAYKTENLCKVLKDAAVGISEDNASYTSSNIYDEERRKFINYIAKDIYKRQKELLPALLNL